MTIFLAAVATWIHVQGGTWVPTTEINAIQAGLRPHVEAAAASRGRKLPEWHTYTFQYQGEGDPSRRVVVINAFCIEPPADVKTRMVVALDGGTCFFNVKYDALRGAFVELQFNGEG
jgi:hypothetical protein